MKYTFARIESDYTLRMPSSICYIRLRSVTNKKINDMLCTPSVCSYRAPLNWNRCPFVATLRRSTRSVLVRLKSYVELNDQLLVKALFVSISIVSFKGTLANREDTSYETRMSPFSIYNSRISFANSKLSVTVSRFKDRGLSLTSSHFAKA